MNGKSTQKITVPGCKGLPCGSTNLSYCLVDGVRTFTWCCLSCVATGMDVGVLVLETSWTVELFPEEGIPLVYAVLIGVCSTAVVLVGVSGTGVVDMGVGWSVGSWIPWLFRDGLPDPTAWFMSVTSLLVSLHDAMQSFDGKLLWACIVKCFDCQYCGEQKKNWQVSGVPTLLKICYPIRAKLLCLCLFIFKVITLLF